MNEIQTQSKLFTRFSPEKLLRGRLFLVIEGQLLFYSEKHQEYILTRISDEEEYTADHIKQLPEGAPYELIHGKLIYMASPERIHQEIASNLNLEIGSFVKTQKLGKVYLAPMDVHFDEKNVYQPDLLFVSVKRQSIMKRWIMGAPDFIVEITSGSTEDRDKTVKMETYGKYNVLEYWIVYPGREIIEVYHNKNKQMHLAQEATKSDTITSKAIEGLQVLVQNIFEGI